MTRSMTRSRTRGRTRGSGAHRAERATQYPHDYLHHDRPYAEIQSDIGGSLFLGAITLIALMTLIVIGLV
jgi:hypothetical protein